jgi:hypothetical protein
MVCRPDASPSAPTGHGAETTAGVKSGDRTGRSMQTPTAPPGPPGQLPHADALAGTSSGAGPPASAWAVTHPGWRAPALELSLRVHHAKSGSGRSPDGQSPSG